jgi:hypothetical protein
MHFPRTAALHYGLSSVDTPINRPDGWPTKLALRRTGHAAGRQRARWYRGHWHAFAPTRFRVIRVNIGCDPCGRAAGRHGARQPSAWRIVRPGAGNPDLGSVEGLTPEPFSNVISCKMCFGAARPMGAGLYLVARRVDGATRSGRHRLELRSSTLSERWWGLHRVSLRRRPPGEIVNQIATRL